MVLIFGTKMSIEIFTWILTILDVGTKIADIELREVIVVLKSILKYRTESTDPGAILKY